MDTIKILRYILSSGPRIAKNIDPTNLAIITRVNGATKQKSNTNQMIFNAFQLVSFVSAIMTLMPGDIISTGTPPASES